ncbi:hypothetical protein BJY52DRAFT_1183320 [Lactarius psammicola]|nr:hypothetical protein BJY52DRAFT_1183320 [Lactarius psammicola]
MASEGNSSSSSTAKPPQGDSPSGAKSLFMLGPGFSVPPRHPIPLVPPPTLAFPAQPDPVPSRSPISQTHSPTSSQPQGQGVDPPVIAGRRNRLLEPRFRDDTPPGWEKYIHLDGSTYYLHVQNRLLTPDDVTQPRIRECLWRLLNLVKDTLTKHNLLHKLPPDFEVVAERMDPEVPEVFYFVSQMSGQVINYTSDCPCKDPSHLRDQCPNPKLSLKKAPTTSFWKHLASYPMHIQSLPDSCESDFLKALTHGVNERILDEQKSMFPYTDEQAQRFMQVYRDLKSSAPYGHERYLSVLPALAWHISRVMLKIETVRERYHYGTKKARVYRDIAVERRTWRDRLEDVLLFCVLFNSHRTYKDRLESTRPKGHVYLPDFRELIKSLLVEWSDSNLLATVFVSANVAFLALPNINALAQTASLVSTLFSMLSIVIGVHHVWRHRRRADADDEDASRYLRLRPSGHHGSLTLLACLLALPLAALLWAILSFTVAVATFCFVSTNVHTRPLLGTVLGVLLALAVLTLLVFWDAWREQPTSEPEEDYARGVGAGRELVREAWLTNKIRRMNIARVRVMDGLRERLTKAKTAVGRALGMGRTADGKGSGKV